MKFKMGGSGGEGAGAGWIGKRFFEKAGEEFETDDPVMIDLLKKSKMAIEVPEVEIDLPDIKIIQEPLKEKQKTKRR